jgi:cytochrome c oxidase accessory protein FixG
MQTKRPNRNTVTTINEDGSRFFLYPADARGRFTTLRRIVAAVLIAIYVGLPWLPIGGHPAVFLDVANRRFHLFGQTLAFQDTWLLFFGITGLGFLLFVVTALLGRIWCGYACPQTVFLEHVYRRIERLIEGDAPARKKLAAAPWSPEKVAKFALKQGIFFLISTAIAHILLSYFVSLPGLWGMMTSAPTEHWGAFLFVGALTLVLHGNFAWFREQLCIIICPYGRLQSALIDDDTITIGYDERRGEPRGRLGTPQAGACIDCNRCVAVCPTGIDIRQGLQMECIACAACVDACDEVMAKVKRPTGLIRYDSLNAFRGGVKRFLRPRVIAYAVLMLAGCVAATIGIRQITPAYMLAVRMPGTSYVVTKTHVQNIFQVRIVNKRDTAEEFEIGVRSDGRELRLHGVADKVRIEPLGETLTTVVVEVPRKDFDGRFPLVFELQDAGHTFEVQRRLTFVGPDPRALLE